MMGSSSHSTDGGFLVGLPFLSSADRASSWANASPTSIMSEAWPVEVAHGAVVGLIRLAGRG